MRGAFAAATLALLSGCVERIIQVRSDPPGAEIWIDGERAGETPADIPFHWYGDREIVLRKPGYRSVQRVEEIGAPWWQIFPLDFVTEVTGTDSSRWIVTLADGKVETRTKEEVKVTFFVGQNHLRALSMHLRHKYWKEAFAAQNVRFHADDPALLEKLVPIAAAAEKADAA